MGLRRADGTRSRTVDTAALIAVLGAVQTGLSTYGIHTALPEQYHWLYGAGMIGLGAWLAYLRSTTTQPLA